MLVDSIAHAHSDVYASSAQLAKRLLAPLQSRPPPQLPNELLTEIFEAVDKTKRMPTLYSLCLVSKRFRLLAEPLLYRDPTGVIQVGAYNDHLLETPLTTRFFFPPSLVPQVETLQLVVSCRGFPPYFRPEVPPMPVFPNVDTLAITTPQAWHWCHKQVMFSLLRALAPYFPRLDDLDLSSAPFRVVFPKYDYSAVRKGMPTISYMTVLEEDGTTDRVWFLDVP
ncbi:hypothetical protein JCM10049v2_006213 [Rhodotorula toruloides]